MHLPERRSIREEAVVIYNIYIYIRRPLLVRDHQAAKRMFYHVSFNPLILYPCTYILLFMYHVGCILYPVDLFMYPVGCLLYTPLAILDVGYWAHR
jgi:hypothetical protein